MSWAGLGGNCHPRLPLATALMPFVNTRFIMHIYISLIPGSWGYYVYRWECHYLFGASEFVHTSGYSCYFFCNAPFNNAAWLQSPKHCCWKELTSTQMCLLVHTYSAHYAIQKRVVHFTGEKYHIVYKSIIVMQRIQLHVTQLQIYINYKSHADKHCVLHIP